MAKDIATGILLTPEVVEWTALRQSKGRSEVFSDGRIALPPFVDAEPDAAAVSLLEKLPGAISKTSVVMALPSTQLLLRILELPAVDPEELADMVELQVDKFSPFPIDQIVVSHEVLARDENDCTVLVAAAKEKVIDEAGEELKQQGLRIERIDAALLGRWKTIVDSTKLSMEGRETLVIISDNMVEVLTHETGNLIALSCLGRISDLDDPEAAVEVAQEVAHLMMGVEVERGRARAQTVTLWSEGDYASFSTALESVSGVLVHECSLRDLPSVSHGVALRALSGGGLLDLTPDAWRRTASSSRTRRLMLVSALVIFGLWGLLVGGGLGMFAFEKNRLHRLEASAARWLEPANEVRRLRLQVNMIERYTDRTYSALESLREISQLQPEGVDLTSFTYRKGGGMDLAGDADSGQLVNQFNESLNQSPLFVDVKSGTRTLTSKGRHRFSFDIKFPEIE